MKNVIKGLVYQPYVKSKTVDIYGNEFDLDNVVSYRNQPIETDEQEIIEGYTPQYSFKRPELIPVLEEPKSAEMIDFSEVTSSSTNKENESAWNKAYSQYRNQLGLKDDKAYTYLLGQILHESGDFNYMEEIADGSAYEGRTDLGNVNKGDGKKYKGRGPIQVTGRSNYEQIYNNFFVPNGLGNYDVINNPELANDPYIGSLLSIGWLTATENGKKAIAESNNGNIEALTQAINGGSNGLDDRIRRTNELLKQHS